MLEGALDVFDRNESTIRELKDDEDSDRISWAWPSGERTQLLDAYVEPADFRVRNNDGTDAREDYLKQLFSRLVVPQLDDGLRLARNLTGNLADAEDVLQEACLSAFRAIGAYRAGNARNWFLTIVRHAGYQWMRRNRSTSFVLVANLELVEEAVAETEQLATTTPEADLIAKIDAKELSASLSAIPTPFRETLKLRVEQDHSYREISEIMRIPIGTVMSRLARARQHLLTVGHRVSDV